MIRWDCKEGYRPWVGVDFDGTLVEHHAGDDLYHIGRPIGAMMDFVRQLLADGREVKIFTARLAFTEPWETRLKQQELLKDWSREHFGVALPATCQKDPGMVALFDDRAFHVVHNTGGVVRPPSLNLGCAGIQVISLEDLSDGTVTLPVGGDE